jgi:predicted nucleic acid-binding protein
VSRFVIDASIVLAWCFPDEHSAVAQHVAEKFKQGDTALATSFWPHEVLNALLAGEKRKRISSALSRTFLEELATLPIVLEQFASGIVFERVEALSRKHDLTAYDAAYLDLALENGLPLASLDEDLIRACKKAGAELLQT